MMRRWLRVPNFRLDSRAINGRSALHLAAAMGHVQLMHELLDSGAQLDARDRFQCTPLDDAINGKHMEAVDLLASLVGCFLFRCVRIAKSFFRSSF
jgi:[histone H3]-lysine9 N-trimethyltransferase EHMT